MPKDQEEYDKIHTANLFRGIYCCLLFMLSYSYLKPYLAKIFKPYERFWEMVTMAARCYVCYLIMMINVRPDVGRGFWQKFDPAKIGKGLSFTDELHIYTDNCELSWETIKEQVDHYFIIHWVNWFLASFVLRDAYIIHFWHLFDEIIELSW